MKALIENYRGFEISFDTEAETFYVLSDSWDTDCRKPSYKSAKKWVDEFLQENNTFKPFWVEPNPIDSNKDKKVKIIGIRKDGAFVYEDSNGQKKQLSKYDEKYYIIPDERNEPLITQIEGLLKQEEEISKKIKGIQKKLFVFTLNEYKKEHPELIPA